MAEIDEIRESRSTFSLDVPLTDEEQTMLGRAYGSELKAIDAPFRVQEIEDAGIVAAAVEDKAQPSSNQEYNSQYLYYMGCQTLVALKAFTEGWTNFQELVLNPYVAARRRENAEYRGDDRDKAFALRLKQLAAEDFVAHINECMLDAEQLPKPSLKQE